MTAAPLMIHRADGHLALANSAALEAAGIRSDEEGVERDADGRSDRTHHEGRGGAARPVGGRRRSTTTQIQELQLRAAALGASNGVTSAHEMSMPHWLGLRDLQVFLGHRERLPMDVEPVVATMDIPQIMDLGLPSIGGDLPMDGSIGARTAAVMAPYADSPGDGITYHADEELAAFFRAGHMAGLQVGVHAIGDRAIEQVITVWERVYTALDSRERRHFRARRHRIEHFEMASAAQVERAAMLGLAVSVQPTFDRYWGAPGGLYDTGLGWERAATMNPVPDDDRARDRGRRGIGQSDHAVRPGAVDRGVRDASRCGATTLEVRGDPDAHVGRRAPGASGRQERGAGSGHARGHGGVRRGPDVASRASKGCARSSRCRSDARCQRAERRSSQRRTRTFACASSVCHSLSPGRIDAPDPRAVAFPSRHRPGGGAR